VTAQPPAVPVPPVVDIIIPGYENMPLTRRLLQSMRQTTGVPINVIYVDNGSSPYDVGQLLGDYPGIQIVRLNQNYGFVRAMNAGMAQAFLSPAPFMLWLNNDVEVPKGDPSWLERLIAPFQDAAIAATGAVSDNVFGMQRYEQPGPDLQEVAILIGFALCVRKSAAQTIGFLDERFGIGNYEDWDYSLRLRARGWKLLAVESVWLHHKLHQTFNKINVDMDALLQTNLNYLVSKWGQAKLGELGIFLEAQPAEPPAGPAPAPAEPVKSVGQDAAWGISAADALSADELAAASHHAQEFQSAAEPQVRLVTHATASWLPKVQRYLDSLEDHCPWETHLLIVADHRNADISPAWPKRQAAPARGACPARQPGILRLAPARRLPAVCLRT
jgi:GT2 family glycosyltransferase